MKIEVSYVLVNVEDYIGKLRYSHFYLKNSDGTYSPASYTLNNTDILSWCAKAYIDSRLLTKADLVKHTTKLGGLFYGRD